MAYIRKNSTLENFFYDETLQKCISVKREAEIESLILRKGNTAIEYIKYLKELQSRTPDDFMNIDQFIWEDIKNTVLNNFINYNPVFTSLFKNTSIGLIYAWNETEACRLTDAQSSSVGFLVFNGTGAGNEIALRKNDIVIHESILDTELNQRKLDLLKILQSQ